MNIYYVYAYLREDSTPYYIGKGKNDRAWSKSGHASRGIYLPKDPGGIILLAENLTNQEALDLEAELIKYYGRKDIGTGILHNKTDGGPNPVLYGTQNGMTGKHHTPETLYKISKAKKGRKHNKKNINTRLCLCCGQLKNTRGFDTHFKHCIAKCPAVAQIGFNSRTTINNNTPL